MFARSLKGIPSGQSQISCTALCPPRQFWSVPGRADRQLDEEIGTAILTTRIYSMRYGFGFQK